MGSTWGGGGSRLSIRLFVLFISEVTGGSLISYVEGIEQGGSSGNASNRHLGGVWFEPRPGHLHS
jgi:hypothetical protein